MQSDTITPAEWHRMSRRHESKYRNLRTRGFQSKKEADRYQELELLQRAGTIRNLRTQVPYQIKVHSVPICKYIADFVYQEGNETVVEDAKGYRTPVFRLKQKLMKAVYGIEIKLV